MRIAKYFLGVSAALAILSPSVGFSDTIEYSTVGYFGAVPSVTSVSAGGQSIAFSGVSDVSVNTPTILSFGTFTPSFGSAGTSGSFAGDLFTLLITQINGPSSSTQSLTGTLAGNLGVSGSGSPSSTVLVNFGTQTVSFDEGNGNLATYSPFSTPLGTEDTTAQGYVSSAPELGSTPVTPLPKSVWGGLGLFSLMALAGAARRVVAL